MENPIVLIQGEDGGGGFSYWLRLGAQECRVGWGAEWGWEGWGVGGAPCPGGPASRIDSPMQTSDLLRRQLERSILVCKNPDLLQASHISLLYFFRLLIFLPAIFVVVLSIQRLTLKGLDFYNQFRTLQKHKSVGSELGSFIHLTHTGLGQHL